MNNNGKVEEYSLFASWESETIDHLYWAGTAAFGVGLCLTNYLGSFFLDWKLNFSPYVVALVLICILIVGYSSFRNWYLPTQSVPIAHYGQRNSMFVSACWPGFLFGVFGLFGYVYLGRHLDLNGILRVGAFGLPLLALGFLSGKLALVSAKFDCDNGYFYSKWLQ
jgi:hypothetical protein